MSDKFPCKTWRGEPAKYAHWKYDGHYTRIVTGQFGDARVYTSHPHDITHQVAGYDWFRPHFTRVPWGTIVLGELYVPKGRASDVKTALVNRWPHLQFVAFAVETQPADWPLPIVATWCHAHGIMFAQWERIQEGDTVESLMAKLPEGLEGYVLKDSNLLNWRKLKREKTIDLVFEDYTDGQGKYANTIGSLVCVTTEGHEVATVSGMDDELRWAISENPHDYLERVVEVKYQCVGSRGRLRHPRFVRWRDDKTIEECSVEQDPDLAEHWRG